MAARGTYSKSQIDEIRDKTRLSDVVGRFVIWDRKKTQARRGDYWACCPLHGEKSPSFHVEDSKGRYHCFGCGVTGDVFKFLMLQTGCTFPQAVAQLGGEVDEIEVDPAERARRDREHAAKVEAAKIEGQKAEQDTRDHARQLWQESRPLPGTLAETYLRGRGADFPLYFPSLRFHPGLRYPGHGRLPALIAGVQDPAGGFLGIWRIYLDELGNKNAKVPDAKLGLGAYTEAGGAVRLGEPVGACNATEGIETGLGVFGITGGHPVLAALNTSGLVNLVPPHDCDSLLIWPDGDVDRIRSVQGKERKIESPGLRAAEKLLERLSAEGFPVSVQPTPRNGRDYLDVYNRMRKRFPR